MIVEAVIASLVDNLISHTVSLCPKLHILGGKANNVVAEIKRWHIILEDLRWFLQDAEDKKQDDPTVLRWLDELEDLTYDTEDILEEFNYETVRYQVELAKPPCESSSSWLNSPKRQKICWPNSDLLDKLDDISQRMQTLKDRIENLNLLRSAVRTSAGPKWRRDPSVSLPNEPAILARDEEKEAILRMLLTQEEGEARIMAIPIVGMGGLGKTTLARYVYNDSRVESSFDVRGWVRVTSNYDTIRISKEMLESVCGNCGEVSDKSLDWIQRKLGEALKNKKFLLVLDDTWNDKYADWNALLPPFLRGLSGSQIIVTTRSHHVANAVGTVDPITPRHLSDEDCWSLLCIHAALDKRADAFLMLEKIGRKIASKCYGLPLAAISVGGLLRNKMRVEQWKAILDRMLKDGCLDIMSVLMMSYNDLDSQLKRCFSFLSLFPVDYQFKENEVVLLWVGAGLIQVEEGKEKSKKEMGHEVFHRLLSRSLLSQQSGYYRSHVMYNFHDWFDDPRYVMHDLIRDVAKQVCGRNCCIGKDDVINESFKSIRHLSFHGFKLEDIANTIEKEPKCLLPFRTFWGIDFYCSEHKFYDLHTVFERLKYIRFLRLHLYWPMEMKELPEYIGRLTLLRYLDVGDSYILSLPTSITSLYNLEILILRGCRELQELPEKIGNLINLWYLDICGTLRLKELPEGIKKLKGLRNLSDFKIGEKSPVSSLGNLNLLRGCLEISGLENVASPEDARLAQLSEKRLEKLTLNWSYSAKRSPAEDILEKLQPSEDLKELIIDGYPGPKLPNWITGPLRYLSKLSLRDCDYCTSQLEAMASLEKLKIIDCPQMSVSLGRLPLLRNLKIGICKKVECTETFSLASLERVNVCHLQVERMSHLFKEKLRLGSCHAKFLEFKVGSWRARLYQSAIIPRWHLPDMHLIGDDYSCQMKVQSLIVREVDSLPKWVSNAPSLQHLRVEDCPSLKVLLPWGEFPSSVTQLSVSDCNELESFHKEKLPTTIQLLEITNCSVLEKKIEDRDQQLCSKISHIPSIKVSSRIV